MTLSLQVSRTRATRISVFLLLLLQLFFSSAKASDETIELEGPNGLTPYGSDLGPLNPCQGVSAVLFSYVVPTGYSLQKVEWYGNNVLQSTTYSGGPGALHINSRDANDKFVVSAKVYYVSGSSTIVSVPNNVLVVDLRDISFAIRTQSQSAIWGCSAPITFTASILSGPSQYFFVPTPDQYTVSWTLPAGWTFSGASTGNSVVVIPPNTGTTGNITATLNMNCGYSISNSMAITMSAPAPTFGTNPFAICNNSTNTFTVSPPCGATSYTWTLSGNTGATFQANGTQSLTTTSTSAVVSAASVGTSGANLYVAANYPGGVTSGAANYHIVTGILPAPNSISPNSGSEVLPPNSMAEFYSPGANTWSVINGTVTDGQGTPDVAILVANKQSGIVTIKISAVDACGASPTYTASFNIGSGPNPLVSHPSRFDSASAGLNISEPLSITNVGLFPNPATSSVQVTIPATDFSKTFIKIYDMNGRPLQTVIPFATNTVIDISHWGKGMYIVEIFDGKKMTTKKFIRK
jgi:hypothetical protein